MKRLFWRLAPEVVLGSFLVSAGGCDPKHELKAGPPELVSFSVVSNVPFVGGLTTSGDAGLIAVPGYVHLTAVFDRLLDGAAVTAYDGGVDFGADVDTITLAPALPGGVSISYTSIYTPNGDTTFALFFPPGPSITTTADPTFPSNATITAVLDRTQIRSKKGEPFVGDVQIMFQTQPFAAEIAVPMGDPDPDAGADAGPPTVKPEMQPVTITFNNVPAADIKSHVSVTADGAPYTAFTVDADGNGNATLFNLTPTAAWPANTTIAVTVDATAADALSGAISEAATASFTTGSTAP